MLSPVHSRHCERSEAIQRISRQRLDCFVALLLAMTTEALRARCRLIMDTPQQSRLDRLDLQRQILRIDTALREAAGDEPQPGLWRAHVHVAQLLAVAKAPDRPDAVGDCIAEQLAYQEFLPLVAGGQYAQIGRDRL